MMGSRMARWPWWELRLSLADCLQKGRFGTLAQRRDGLRVCVEGSGSVGHYRDEEVLRRSSTIHFSVRYVNTIGEVELDLAKKVKSPGSTLPDVQHAFVERCAEYGYETLLSNPGGISTDLDGELVFISDTSHHRIIIADGSGKVLDYIGSVAGFEDGAFEAGQLQRPSSTFYDPDQKCLYIADCENHAIRRADLVSRTLETVYPRREEPERQGIVHRFLCLVGLRNVYESNGEGDTERDAKQLAYPWHLAMAPSGHVLAATEGFEKLWMIDISSGEAKIDSNNEPDVALKKFMDVKLAETRETTLDWALVHDTLLSKGMACEGFSNLVSQVATLKHQVLVLHQEMHQILKMDLKNGQVSSLQLSNLGLLGIPSWWSPSVNLQFFNSLSAIKNVEELDHQDVPQDPVAVFQVQPGRCLICVDVTLPKGTVLAEPVDEDCLLRQGRGSLVELSTFMDELTGHKVTAAQQYLDDLHSMEEPDDSIVEDTTGEDLTVPKQSPNGLPFYSSVDVSLGSGEVVFDGVVYLNQISSAGFSYIPTGSLIATGPAESTDTPLDHPGPVNTHLKRVLSCDHFAATMVKRLHLRVRLEVSADAPLTRMLLVNLQL